MNRKQKYKKLQHWFVLKIKRLVIWKHRIQIYKSQFKVSNKKDCKIEKYYLRSGLRLGHPNHKVDVKHDYRLIKVHLERKPKLYKYQRSTKAKDAALLGHKLI